MFLGLMEPSFVAQTLSSCVQVLDQPVALFARGEVAPIPIIIVSAYSLPSAVHVTQLGMTKPSFINGWHMLCDVITEHVTRCDVITEHVTRCDVIT